MVEDFNGHPVRHYLALESGAPPKITLPTVRVAGTNVVRARAVKEIDRRYVERSFGSTEDRSPSYEIDRESGALAWFQAFIDLPMFPENVDILRVPDRSATKLHLEYNENARWADARTYCDPAISGIDDLDIQRRL